MKKKTEGEIIADEVWRMLPEDVCKIMKGLKKPFKESIAADVDDIVDKAVKREMEKYDVWFKANPY